jgi:tetratricopeptide (TPR) repeat protein
MNRPALALAVLAAAAACKRSEPASQPAPPASQALPPGSPLAPPPAATGASPQIAALEQMAQKEPKNAQLWTQLGNLYFDSHQPQKAIDAYAKALELKPNDPDVLTDQGIMYRELKKFDLAVANFEKANKADPNHVQSVFNAGVVYAYDLGLTDKAIAAWNKVIAMAPQSQQAASARQALEDVKSRAKR